jgi:hypothetical protein
MAEKKYDPLFDPEAMPGTNNRHFSVDANGDQVMDITFEEEPIGMPHDQGTGFAQIEFGEVLGFKSDRYVVTRKLGWGRFSSVWLARDTK